MKRLLAVSILIFLVGFIGSAYAPENQKFTVFVTVDCKDKNTNSLIQTHVKKELRLLQDVEVVGSYDDAIFLFKIIVIEPLTPNGLKSGNIVMTYSFQERFFASSALPPFLRKRYPERFPAPANESDNDTLVAALLGYDTLRELLVLTPIVFAHDWGLSVGETINVPNQCVQIVSIFDTKVLKKFRIDPEEVLKQFGIDPKEPKKR